MSPKKSFELYRQGRRLGVFTELQIERMARAGQLQPSDEVAALGTTTRRRVADIGGLLDAPAAALSGGGPREAAPPPFSSAPPVEPAESWTPVADEPPPEAAEARGEVLPKISRRFYPRRRRGPRGDQTALTLFTLGLALVALVIGIAVVVLNQR